MRDIIWEDFWWKYITGPSVLISKVVEDLTDGVNVVLMVPSDLPWRHSMRSEIQSEFRSKSSSFDTVIEMIDEADDNSMELSPGRLILDRFADAIVQKGFREKSKISIQDYISQRKVLKNRIVWVKGLSKKSATQWINFCKAFSSGSPDGGLFLLEIHDNIPIFDTGKIHFADYNKYVSRNDLQLINSFILDGLGTWSNTWKSYISSAAAYVCDTDAEISEKLIKSVDFNTLSPLEGIASIEKENDYSRRGEDSSSAHILKLYREGNLDEINRRIWTAQVQTLFPIIEMERVNTIKNYYEQICRALQALNIYQYGKIIIDPIDVELGTLCYLMSRRDEENQYFVFIPNDTDRDRIRFLHGCRNIIAHANCLSPKQISTLLSDN